MAVFGHSGSQAPQLIHSLVIVVAISQPNLSLNVGKPFHESAARRIKLIDVER
jgi:hypothetical protein